MQLSLIDPRYCPVATAEMLGDGGLRAAIKMMQGGRPIDRGGWPYVERLTEISGRPAWLVHDQVNRYVVVGGTVFFEREFGILNLKIRTAAEEAFARLDAAAAAQRALTKPGSDAGLFN